MRHQIIITPAGAKRYGIPTGPATAEIVRERGILFADDIRKGRRKCGSGLSGGPRRWEAGWMFRGGR